MYCKKCGTKNDEDAIFCFKCGTELTIPKDTASEGKVKEIIAPETKKSEFNDFQEVYIKKLRRDLLTSNGAEEFNINEIYEKAKKYDIQKEQIDEIVNNSKQIKNEIFKVINTAYEEAPDYVIDDDMEEQIINYGAKFGLNESQMEKYIEQYEEINRIEEKQDLYADLTEQYISEFFNKEFNDILHNELLDTQKEIKRIEVFAKKMVNPDDLEDLESRINELIQYDNVSEDGFTKAEYNIIAARAKEGVKKVKDAIEKQYLNSEEISDEILDDLIEVGDKYGLDNCDIAILIITVEKQIGIYEKKRNAMLKGFDIKVDELLAEPVRFGGQEREFEGKYFLEDYILYYLIDDIVDEAVEDIGNIKANDPDALEKIARALVLSNNNMHEEIIEFAKKIGMEEELLGDGGDEYNGIDSDILKFVEEKCDDIMAACKACVAVKEGAEYEKQYRELRKQSRGKWVGGGFGLGGAIGGAAQAGLLNAGSGLLHSTVNIFGDIHSDNKAKSKIIEIVKQIRGDIVANFKDVVDGTELDILGVIKEKHPEAFWVKDENEAQKALAKYLEGTNEEKKNLGWELLKTCPENVKVYLQIFEDNPDRQCKEELIEIAELFDIEAEVKKEIDKRLKDSIAVLDISTDEKNIALLYQYIVARYKEEAKGRRKFVVEVSEQCLKVKRDDYCKIVTYIVNFDRKQYEGKLVPELQNMMSRNIEEIQNIISENENMKDFGAKIDKLYQEIAAHTELEGEIRCYHKIIDIYIQSEVRKASIILSVDDLKNADEIKETIIEVQKKYYIVPDKQALADILQNRFENELQATRDTEKLKALKEKLIELEKYWDVSVDDLEAKFEGKIENEEKTVYDLSTSYRKGQSTIATLFYKNPGKVFENSIEARNLKWKINSVASSYYVCDLESEQSISKCLNEAEEVYKECGMCYDLVQELKARLSCLDEKSRTVGDTVYATLEAAEEERKYYADGNRYDTIEEANAEREKMNNECKQILAIERASGSNAEKLFAIKKQNFTCTQALIKEKYYESRVVKEYYDHLSKRPTYESATKTKGICLVLGVLVVIFGINPLIYGGWGVKIVVAIIAALVYEYYKEGNDKVKELKSEMEALKAIEKRFKIEGNEAKLKK